MPDAVRFPLVCECTTPGVCNATGEQRIASMVERCQQDARYRWILSGRPRSEWPEELRALPSRRKRAAKPARPEPITRPACVHLGRRQLPPADPLGVACGCPGREVWACDVHGRCTRSVAFEGVACCRTCGDYEADDREPTRHLAYFVYPVSGNGVWQRNVEHIRRREHLFTGRRVVAISTGCDRFTLDPPDAVREAFGPTYQFIEVPSETVTRQDGTPEHIGEVAAWVPLWREIIPHAGAGDLAFYAHAKGVTKPVNKGVAVHRWVDLMYAANLDHWPDVAGLLSDKAIVGAFLKDGPCFNGRARWHYTGTFYWLRLDQFAERDWGNVPRHYGGTELWPALNYHRDEAGCVFYGGRGFSMYRLREVANAEAAYQRWPAPGRRFPATARIR